MDFPLFHLDTTGDRLLIAVVAILHVVVNHTMAVGAYPLIAMLEWRSRREPSGALDNLARRITFVTFLITTTLGALSGVGIWLSATLVAPFGIGSLLRVFFWGWFAEWIVFIIEVVLILTYYLTWSSWSQGKWKRIHLGVGIALSVFSWLTMSLIVAILGFMMSTGVWTKEQSFWSAFYNPLYLPQLAFRTTYAFTGGGLFVWFLAVFFTKDDAALRMRVVRLIAATTLFFIPLCALAAWWYWSTIPASMADNLNVGLLTIEFSSWLKTYVWIAAAALGSVALVTMVGLVRPQAVPRAVLVVPFFLGIAFLGHFERAREFIRKPFIIADYMYSNGVRVMELPLYQRDGILKYALYVGEHEVTETNRLAAGRDLFMLSCSRCHTTDGVNGVRQKIENLFGKEPWQQDRLTNFIKGMHLTRTFMPPFPGNQKEAQALATYLTHLQSVREAASGVQTIGLILAPATATVVSPDKTTATSVSPDKTSISSFHR